MPRKKTSPPPLDEVIELSSGLVIEIGSVEAHAHRSTTRGRSQVIKCGTKSDGLLEHVFNDYFVFADSADGHGEYRVPEKDYMRNPSAFADRQLGSCRYSYSYQRQKPKPDPCLIQ